MRTLLVLFGVAVLVTVASTRTGSLDAGGTPTGAALVEGFQLAFQVGVGMLVVAALTAPLIGRVRTESMTPVA